VKAFIGNHQWNIPLTLQVAFPILLFLVQNVHLPTEHSEDEIIWSPSNSGKLTLKLAYSHQEAGN